MDILLFKNGVKFHDLPLKHKTNNGSMDFIKVILLNVFFLHTKVSLFHSNLAWFVRKRWVPMSSKYFNPDIWMMDKFLVPLLGLFCSAFANFSFI